MEILKVEGLSKSFGGLHILQTLVLALSWGQNCVIGPNGAGKDDLVQCTGRSIAGLRGEYFPGRKRNYQFDPNRRFASRFG